MYKENYLYFSHKEAKKYLHKHFLLMIKNIMEDNKRIYEDISYVLIYCGQDTPHLCIDTKIYPIQRLESFLSYFSDRCTKVYVRFKGGSYIECFIIPEEKWIVGESIITTKSKFFFELDKVYFSYGDRRHG